MLEIYDNIFSYDYVMKSHLQALELPWNYTNIANRYQYPNNSIISKGSHLFFGKRLYERKGLYNVQNNCPEIFLEIIEYFVSKITKSTDLNLQVIDCNLQVLGQDGTVHTDYEENKSSFTVLYYPIIEWKDDWGGALEILNNNDNVIDQIYPCPGRIVFFDSKIKHRALAPIVSGVARMSIAYRLFKNAT